MRHAAALLVVAALAACGTAPTGSTDAGPDAGIDAGPLAPPPVGVQLVSTPVTVPKGGQVYSCWSFRIPTGAPFPIVAIQQQMPEYGLHHYAVFTSSDVAGAGTAMLGSDGSYTNAATPFDCTTMGITWGLVTGGGVGTQSVTFPTNTSMTLNLQSPPPAGQRPITQVILQLHLLNATPDPLTVDPAYINLVSSNSPPSDFQQVGLLIAGNINFTIPANTTGYQVQGGCGGSLDPTQNGTSPAMAHIFAVFPHMHTLGQEISATVTPAGASSPTVLVDKPWNFGEQGIYPVTGSANAGDLVNVTCTFNNPSSAAVPFGLTTQQEMCLGVLFYYPADATQTSQYCGFQD